MHLGLGMLDGYSMVTIGVGLVMASPGTRHSFSNATVVYFNSRQPSANELDGARYQGKHVAQITAKLTNNQ